MRHLLSNKIRFCSILKFSIGSFLISMAAHSYAYQNNEEHIVPYQIMHPSDFTAMAGCEQINGYEHAIKSALNFLVFSELHDGSEDAFRFNQDLKYTQRHSRELFHAIAQSTTCKPANLIRMGIELHILNSDGTINRKTEASKEGAKKVELSNLDDYYIDTKNGMPVFEVLSRSDYMKSTECLVSPKSYHQYHLALFYNLNRADQEKASKHMRNFLNDIGAGRHNDDGSEVADQCMHNSVKILAKDLGLLSENGKFILQQEMNQDVLTKDVIEYFNYVGSLNQNSDQTSILTVDHNEDGKIDTKSLQIDGITVYVSFDYDNDGYFEVVEWLYKHNDIYYAKTIDTNNDKNMDIIIVRTDEGAKKFHYIQKIFRDTDFDGSYDSVKSEEFSGHQK